MKADMSGHILVPAHLQHLPAIVDLWQAQDRRHYALDPLLHPPRTVEQIELRIQDQRQHGPTFVALDEREHVRAYIAPTIWTLSPTSALHAFLTSCNGMTNTLVLPDPNNADSVQVASSVLHFLSAWWHEQKTTGDLLRWPASDRWLEPLLFEQGFLLDSYCALRSAQPLNPSDRQLAEVTIRHAIPADEQRLQALFWSEMEAHASSVPCSRVSEQAMRGFASKLQRHWQESPDQDGDFFILVAEHAAEGVVGMAENVLVSVEWDDTPGFTPPGSYGCLDNVSVETGLQGQGIGRQLTEATLVLFRQNVPQLDGVLLWYNPDNPSANHFWPRLGFHDLWTTYQRMHTTMTL
jgi:ribosomal protein S18 acetylase RimI-like enzyme